MLTNNFEAHSLASTIKKAFYSGGKCKQCTKHDKNAISATDSILLQTFSSPPPLAAKHCHTCPGPRDIVIYSSTKTARKCLQCIFGEKTTTSSQREKKGGSNTTKEPFSRCCTATENDCSFTVKSRRLSMNVPSLKLAVVYGKLFSVLLQVQLFMGLLKGIHKSYATIPPRVNPFETIRR